MVFSLNQLTMTNKTMGSLSREFVEDLAQDKQGFERFDLDPSEFKSVIEEAKTGLIMVQTKYEIGRALDFIESEGVEKNIARAKRIMGEMKEALDKRDVDIKTVLQETRIRLSRMVPKESINLDEMSWKFVEVGSEEDELAYRIMDMYGRDEGKEVVYTLEQLQEKFKGVDEGQFRSIVGRLMRKEKKISAFLSRSGAVRYFCRDREHLLYETDELIAYLHPKYFKRVGEFVKEAIDENGGKITQEYIEEHEKDLNMPVEFVEQIINAFFEKGAVSRTATRYKLTKVTGNRAPDLETLRNVDLAIKYKHAVPTDKVENETLTLDQEYEDFRKRHAIDEYDISLNKKKGVNVLHLTEANFGYKDLDYKFMYEIIESIKALPQNERPDLIMLSGLVFGNFQHLEKNNRRARVFKEDRQFEEARKFIRYCEELGVHVIYNISDNDEKIIKSWTYDAVQMIKNLSKPQKDEEKKAASYYGFDQAFQSPQADAHYEFMYYVGFEYMLRCGRGLYSADQMEATYGVRMEEYLLLMDAYNALSKGEPVSPLAEKVLEIDNIPVPQKRGQGKLLVSRDAIVKVHTKGNDYSIKARHEFRQTAVTMPQDPTKALRNFVALSEADGEEGHDMVLVQNQELGLGVQEGRTMILSTPGMNTNNPDEGSFSRNISSDKGVRKRSVRGDNFKAGAISTEMLDDGRRRIRFFNKKLMDLSAKTPERVALVHNSDWQTGSVTARPDYQAKWLDYVFHEVLKRYKAFMMFNGDIIQGRNYPDMPNENPNMGLIRVDDQMLFVGRLIDEVMSEVPRANMSNLEMVGVVPGNHEWNTDKNYTGMSYSTFLQDVLGRSKTPSKLYRCTVTGRGEHMKAYTGIEDYHNHKFIFQHMFLERGGKGSGGLPILAAKPFVMGGRELIKNVDLLFAGHFHEPSFMQVGNKIATINGSMAGLSGYEWMRGYNPVIGGSVMYVGGGLPPELEIMTAEALNKYKPKGRFASKKLAGMGLEDDEGFNPEEHGFGKILVEKGKQLEQLPQSAIQKYLWRMVEEILWRAHGRL